MLERLIDKDELLAALPPEWRARLEPLPPATRLILAAEDLLASFGTRTDDGRRITAEWGEQQPGGWYEPVFTATEDDTSRFLAAREPLLALVARIADYLVAHEALNDADRDDATVDVFEEAVEELQAAGRRALADPAIVKLREA